MGLGLTGKTLGIIGAGGIGWETARLAAAFDMRVLVARSVRNQETQPRHGAQFAPLETVLAQADFLALTCRLSEETRHLIDAARLSKMKPTAFLINVARGAVADERALIAALQQGIIAGAGLDVFEQEPVDPGNPLLAMDNVILTPHALGWTDESFSAIGQTAAADILAFAGHCVPAHVVNPEALSHPRLAAWLGNGRDEPVARRAPFQLMP
jgi:phosphoglycerate dehydrogenase-like enzyme